MDKVKKFLKRLSLSEREDIDDILQKLEQGNIKGLDIKKLKGHEGLFRVRKGDIRVVCSQGEKSFNVIFIGRRGDSKYKQF